MLRSTVDTSRLYLTAELLAVESLPLQKNSPGRFATEVTRFPPVEEVVSVLDRIALRAFAA